MVPKPMGGTLTWAIIRLRKRKSATRVGIIKVGMLCEEVMSMVA